MSDLAILCRCGHTKGQHIAAGECSACDCEALNERKPHRYVDGGVGWRDRCMKDIWPNGTREFYCELPEKHPVHAGKPKDGD